MRRPVRGRYNWFITLFVPLLLSVSAQAQTIAVRELRSPAQRGSAESNLSLGGDGRVYLSWIQRLPDTSHTLWFAWLDSSGWSEPRKIAAGRNWFVNWADFPALSVGRYGNMMATWLEKSGADTYAYGIRYSTSDDYGQTWGKPEWLHDDNTETEHGFVSLVSADDGFDAFWLDGREMVNDKPMTLRHAHIDRTGRIIESRVLDNRVCDCCQTSAIRINDSVLVVAYRDRSDDEVRDISVVRVVGEKCLAPQTVHNDGWKIAGCPVNGPSIDADGMQVIAAWFTMNDSDSGVVKCTWSRDGGQSFAAPIQLSAAVALGRVDVKIVGPNEACAIWLEDTGTESHIMVRGVGTDGPTTFPFQIGKTSNQRDSGFPHIVYDGEAIIAVWTDPTAGSLRTARLVFER